jgi:hypothetical protein
MEGLALPELKLASEKTVAPSVIRDRVEALSVSRADLVADLLTDLEGVPVDERERRPFLFAAWSMCQAVSVRPEVDETAADWSWDEGLDMSIFALHALERRPLRDRSLGVRHLEAALARGGGLLRAARFQDVSIEAEVFDPWVDKIAYLAPWIVSMLVELSRKTSFDQQRWREAYLPILQRTEDPEDVIPAVYSLLNHHWWVPL